MSKLSFLVFSISFLFNFFFLFSSLSFLLLFFFPFSSSSFTLLLLHAAGHWRLVCSNGAEGEVGLAAVEEDGPGEEGVGSEAAGERVE